MTPYKNTGPLRIGHPNESMTIAKCHPEIRPKSEVLEAEGLQNGFGKDNMYP